MPNFTFQNLERCPGCKSSNFSYSFSKNEPSIETSFNISCCKNCGLYFVNPRVSDIHLSELYDRNYYSGDNWDSDTDYHSNYDNPQRLTIIKKMYLNHYLIIKESTGLEEPVILDAGAGLGFFAQTILECFPNANIYNIDYSEHAVNHMKSRGLKADVLGIEQMKNMSFDAVYMREVIEHLYDPNQIVEEIYRILKSGGVFFYTTGNTDTVKDMAKWNYVRPIGHLNYFNYNSMKQLMLSKGFSIRRRELQRKGFLEKFKGFTKFILSNFRLIPRELPLGIKI